MGDGPRNREGERAPDSPGTHTDEVEFWEDWRDHLGQAALSPLWTASGALMTFAVVRNAGSADDWYTTMLLGFLLIVGGGALTAGVSVPLLIGWALGTVVVRCSAEGIAVHGRLHSWSTVRALRLGYEVSELGAADDLEGPASLKRYHLEVRTDEEGLRVPGELWRTRGRELLSAVRRFAPGVLVEWASGHPSPPRVPARVARPSRARLRGEAVAMVGLSLALSVLLCAAVAHWAPGWVTLG
ncbi:hypothetical protein [Streptomyces broussonetiae]|uniref:PH domain-containing protein n=1 Tax=Streptomyces broussonetiae TaxID=2686304 RepID=A0ABV5EIK0_9ACTN